MDLDVSAFSEALGRVVSIALQNGISVEQLSETLMGIMGDSSYWDNGKLIKSIPDAVGRILKDYADKLNHNDSEPTLFKEDDKGTSHGGACKRPCRRSDMPRCGEKSFIKTEDCNSCLSCGYSKCG